MTFQKCISAFLAIQFFVTSAMADLFTYRQSVMESISRLESIKMDEFNSAPDSITRAYDLAPDRSSRKLVGDALGVLNKNVKVGQLSDQENISKASTMLKEALTVRPIGLNKSYPMETNLIEKLVLMNMFPANPDKVNIIFEGVDRMQGLWLLASSIVEPRTVLYDNGVKSLITGTDIYGNKAAMSVKFIVEAAEIDPVGDANLRAVSGFIRDKINSFLPQDGSIKGTIRIMDRRTFLYYEFRGYQYVNLINDWVLNSVASLGGNRYLWATANLMETTAKSLSTADFGGVTAITSLVNGLGKKISVAERVVRNRLAASWVEPTVETIINKITRLAEVDQAHMKENLAVQIANIKAANAAEKAAKTKELTKRTAEWIKNSNLKAQSAIKNVNKAIAETETTKTFSRLSKTEQSRALISNAEKASGLKPWERPFTFDRFMKTFTVAIAVGYVVHGVVQMYKADTDEQWYAAYQNTGVKLAHALMFWTPVLREGSITLDTVALGVNLMFERSLGIHLGDTEDVLMYLAGRGAVIGYWSVGLSTFKYQELDIRNHLPGHELFYGVTPKVDSDSGSWKDHALLKLMIKMDACQKTPDDKICLLETFALARELEKSMVSTSRNELTMIYSLNLKTNNVFHKEFSQYEEQKYEQIMGANGYYKTALKMMESAKLSSSVVLEDVVTGSLKIKDSLRERLGI